MPGMIYVLLNKEDGTLMEDVIGVDIGGTKCAVVLGSSIQHSITMVDRASFPTPIFRGVDYCIERVEEAIEALLNKNNRSIGCIGGIGISCGGPLDSKRGVIMSPPNLYGWDDVHIKDIMEDRFKVRTRLQNDANACALAEWKYGAAKGYDNVVFLTFGTGMGAGLILNGRLYSGSSDMAGEVGHIRLENTGPVGYGKAGSFEGFCSGGGIAQLARIKVLEKLQIGEQVSFCENIGMLDGLTAKAVADAARAGDGLAREIYGICGRYLGKGLSIIIDILNPEVIVIGSIFARSRDLLWPWALEVIERESLVYTRNACKVVPASLGEKIGDYAALSVAEYE